MPPELLPLDRHGRPRAVHYLTRCPTCGGLRREAEFAREIEPITEADLVGQVFEGRSRIRTVDRVSYAEDNLLISAIRRRWLKRIRRALRALETIPLEITRRFRGISSYRMTLAPTVEPTAGPAIMRRYGGLYARRN